MPHDNKPYLTKYNRSKTQRICLFSISTVTALNLKNSEWLLYDKYNIFSFDRSSQKRLSVKTALIAIPDGMLSYVEVMTLMFLTPPGKYRALKTLLGFDGLTGVSYIDIPMQVFFGLSSVLSYSVRYKPILNIIYSANSVRAHLEDINNQIVVAGHRFEDPIKQRASGFAHEAKLQDGPVEQQSRMGLSLWSGTGINADADPIGQKGRQVNSIPSRPVQSLAADVGGSAETMQMKRSSESSNRLGAGIGWSLKDWLANQSVYRQEKIFSTSGKLSSISAAINPEADRRVMPVVSEATGAKQQSVCVIRNLHQLEYHISKLSFFVGDMDRCEPVTVFSMCFLVFIQFIYSVFFVIECSKSSSASWQIMLGVVGVLTRLAIPLYLFSSGDWMEKQARKLLANLEIIYLQERSQSLIYKQYGSHTMASLTRVIKLLKSIRFNCDKTMNINLATMKRFFLYAVTTMFIVVQYGKFNGFAQSCLDGPLGGRSQHELIALTLYKLSHSMHLPGRLLHPLIASLIGKWFKTRLMSLMSGRTLLCEHQPAGCRRRVSTVLLAQADEKIMQLWLARDFHLN